VTTAKEGNVKKGLLDEIMEHNRGRAGTVCGVQKLYASLPKDDAKALRQAIADPMVKGTAISKALKARGYHVADGVVTRHRRGECVCES
jgi:hypothetical protein